MKKFQFRLESVLAWREVERTRERDELGRRIAEEQRLKQNLMDLRAQRQAAREELQRRPFMGADLRALAAYLLACEPREKTLLQQLAAAQRSIAEQRLKVLEADRRVRLLVKLRERQLTEWTTAVDRQLDAMAQDSWTASHYLR